MKGTHHESIKRGEQVDLAAVCAAGFILTAFVLAVVKMIGITMPAIIRFMEVLP